MKVNLQTEVIVIINKILYFVFSVIVIILQGLAFRQIILPLHMDFGLRGGGDG